MSSESTQHDRQARTLIRASEPLLRHWLCVTRLDQALVGTLYVRQRSILEAWQATNGSEVRSQQHLIEQLAVAIFMTAAAWQTASQSDVNLLSSLREVVAAGLRPAAIDAGAEDEA